MNIEKVTLMAPCEPRKMNFIKYINNQSCRNDKNIVIEDCFSKALVRENSLVSINFIA